MPGPAGGRGLGSRGRRLADRHGHLRRERGEQARAPSRRPARARAPARSRAARPAPPRPPPRPRGCRCSARRRARSRRGCRRRSRPPPRASRPGCPPPRRAAGGAGSARPARRARRRARPGRRPRSASARAVTNCAPSRTPSSSALAYACCPSHTRSSGPSRTRPTSSTVTRAASSAATRSRSISAPMPLTHHGSTSGMVATCRPTESIPARSASRTSPTGSRGWTIDWCTAIRFTARHASAAGPLPLSRKAHAAAMPDA